MTLVPRAETTTVQGGRLKTVVPVVPDAPIGHFRLTLFGGKQGYLANTRSLCAAPPVSSVEYTAQNGKTLTQKVKTKTALRREPRTQGHSPQWSPAPLSVSSPDRTPFTDQPRVRVRG